MYAASTRASLDAAESGHLHNVQSSGSTSVAPRPLSSLLLKPCTAPQCSSVTPTSHSYSFCGHGGVMCCSISSRLSSNLWSSSPLRACSTQSSTSHAALPRRRSGWASRLRPLRVPVSATHSLTHIVWHVRGSSTAGFYRGGEFMTDHFPPAVNNEFRAKLSFQILLARTPTRTSSPIAARRSLAFFSSSSFAATAMTESRALVGAAVRSLVVAAAALAAIRFVRARQQAIQRTRPFPTVRTPLKRLPLAQMPALKNDLLLRALRGEKTERVPVWCMRQAGRCVSIRTLLLTPLTPVGRRPTVWLTTVCLYV